MRFFFEIRPVDIKAAGSGFAILKWSGVAKEPGLEESDCACIRPAGRAAPIGSDREKLMGGLETSAIV